MQTVMVGLMNQTQTIPLLRFPDFNQVKLFNNREGERPLSFVDFSDVGLIPIISLFHIMDVVVAAQYQLRMITKSIKHKCFSFINWQQSWWGQPKNFTVSILLWNTPLLTSSPTDKIIWSWVRNLNVLNLTHRVYSTRPKITFNWSDHNSCCQNLSIQDWYLPWSRHGPY